jgi:acyl-CoA thioester hydrolase
MMTEKNPAMAGRLLDGRHVLPVRVYYEDTDFSGFVYHANYLRFCERGRSDMLRLLGIHHHELAADRNMVFAVRRMEIDFLKPARIDDVLEVHTRVESISGARFVLAQEVHRIDDVLFTALVTAVLVTPQGRPRRIPADLRRQFSNCLT